MVVWLVSKLVCKYVFMYVCTYGSMVSKLVCMYVSKYVCK
jgi:hypothetical protein